MYFENQHYVFLLFTINYTCLNLLKLLKSESESKLRQKSISISKFESKNFETNEQPYKKH